jgi:ABC-2 type transport system ATP-binding protein
MKGKIYSRAINKDEIAFYRDDYNVISTQLKTGKLHIRIISDMTPAGFEPAEPNLEDVYFSNIATKVDVNTI